MNANGQLQQQIEIRAKTDAEKKRACIACRKAGCTGRDKDGHRLRCFCPKPEVEHIKK